MQRGSPQLATPRMTPVIRAVLIASVAIFLLQLILQAAMGVRLAEWLGFVPAQLLQGRIWQLFTYPFLHSTVFHLIFNLLVIWTVGSELEGLWGARTLAGFFVVCALGAALTYGIFTLLGIGASAFTPMIGSSGVVYGMLLAYGILFGDRMMYFFMLFPIEARYFVMILGAIELVSSVFNGSDGIAHTAHLGGMVFGFFFLMAMASWRQRGKKAAKADTAERERKKRLKKSGHLRLINGEEDEDEPKTWN